MAELKYVSILKMCIVDLGWDNIRVLTVVVRGPNFTKFSFFDAGGNLVDNAFDRLSITQSVPEIFTVKVKSCSTSRLLVDVFCLPKF